MAKDKRKPSVAQRLADLELEVEALSQQVSALVFYSEQKKQSLWQRIKGYFRG